MLRSYKCLRYQKQWEKGGSQQQLHCMLKEKSYFKKSNYLHKSTARVPTTTIITFQKLSLDTCILLRNAIHCAGICHPVPWLLEKGYHDRSSFWTQLDNMERWFYFCQEKWKARGKSGFYKTFPAQACSDSPFSKLDYTAVQSDTNLTHSHYTPRSPSVPCLCN